MVDLEGYVTIHNNRYSVAEALIGRRVEVRETKDRILIFDGIREHCVHRRREPNAGLRSTLPQTVPGMVKSSW